MRDYEDVNLPSVYEIKGVGPVRGGILEEMGFKTAIEVARANPDDLYGIDAPSLVIENAREYVKEHYNGSFLRCLPFVGEATASTLFDNGYLFPEDVANADVSELSEVIGNQMIAKAIHRKANEYIESSLDDFISSASKLGIPIDVALHLHKNNIQLEEITPSTLSYFGVDIGDARKIYSKVRELQELPDLNLLFEELDEEEIDEEINPQMQITIATVISQYIKPIKERFERGEITDILRLNDLVAEAVKPLMEFYSSILGNHIVSYYLKKSKEGNLARYVLVDPISKEELPKENYPQSMIDFLSIKEFCESCDAEPPHELETVVALGMYGAEEEEISAITGTLLDMYRRIADDDLPEAADKKDVINVDISTLTKAFEQAGVNSAQATVYARNILPAINNGLFDGAYGEIKGSLSINGVPISIVFKALQNFPILNLEPPVEDLLREK